jgi:L-aspartate oxidase
MECQRTGRICACLDLTHLRSSFIRGRFPNIYRRCRELGLDITRQPIPVVPAAHYMCGGVVTDASGKTALEGLWASGEVASTGLHGANRLASNSLLEAMYFADVAAKSAGPALRRLRGKLPSKLPPSHLTGVTRIARLKRDWDMLRNTMWDDVGIIREKKGLRHAVARLTELWRRSERRLRVDGVNPDTIEFRNAALVGLLIARSALRRTESRGLQYRSDHPRIDDKNWKKDTVLRGPLR